MKQENISYYGQFMLDNIGFIFVDRKTGMKVYKWEVYNTFECFPEELSQIYDGSHVRYARLSNIDGMDEKKFNF